jgi:peptidoglycan-associated lipoprotein
MNKQRLVSILIVSILIPLGCRKQIASTPPPSTPPPAAVAAAPEISISADRTSIDEGDAVTLAWKTENTTSVVINELGQVEANGSRQVTPKAATTYTATATGPGGSASDSVRVTVSARTTAAVPVPQPDRPSVSLDEDFRNNVQDVYFDYDRAAIQQAESAKLQLAARWLRDHSDAQIMIEGHCDDRGSEEYNLGLGDRRANAVKEFLLAQGISLSRVNTVSYGEERPVCRDEMESCRSRNRRAHFVLAGP